MSEWESLTQKANLLSEAVATCGDPEEALRHAEKRERVSPAELGVPCEKDARSAAHSSGFRLPIMMARRKCLVVFQIEERRRRSLLS